MWHPCIYYSCSQVFNIIHSLDVSVDFFFFPFSLLFFFLFSMLVMCWRPYNGEACALLLEVLIPEMLVWKSSVRMHSILLILRSYFQDSQIKSRSQWVDCLALYSYVFTNEPGNRLSFSFQVWERKMAPVTKRGFNVENCSLCIRGNDLSITGRWMSSWRTQFQLSVVQTTVKGSARLLGTEMKWCKHLEACSEACGLKCRSLGIRYCLACRWGARTYSDPWMGPPAVCGWGAWGTRALQGWSLMLSDGMLHAKEEKSSRQRWEQGAGRPGQEDPFSSFSPPALCRQKQD